MTDLVFLMLAMAAILSEVFANSDYLESTLSDALNELLKFYTGSLVSSSIFLAKRDGVTALILST